jgi:hypothetical protein
MSFPNDQSNPAGAIPVWTTTAYMAQPTQLGGTIAAGGTAQDVDVSFDSASRFLVIQNPPDTASQGVTAENLFVSIDGPAVVNGADNYAVLAAGNTCTIGFPGLAPDSSITVSVVAATTGHKFLATLFSVYS